MLPSLAERAPTKRKVKPAQNLLSLEDLGESSDDSDFRIEDHCEDTDDSLDSDGEERGNDNDDDDNDDDDDSDDDYEDGDDEDLEEDDENSVDTTGITKLSNVLAKADERKQITGVTNDAIKIMICCVCLGDRSDATNEIVECDGCGVTVHEGCYGVSENDSFSSTVSSCSTMPWFCEACRAGVDNPECELCPNTGGIYKETDVGKWVHLVCALYIPGVAFGEVDKLGSVTLFEMAYSKWGAKACQLCADKRLARTGVAVGCDAGMCRSYFHVTCGQAHGLLAEAHSEEVEQADPFYAHCKLHSEKTMVRKRRRNWLALQLRTDKRKEEYSQEGHSHLPQQLRIHRKLEKYRGKYSSFKITKPTPWVPTQKMGRLLTTSASACRALWRKAELSGIDVEAWEVKEAQVAALTDVHRKWYIPPAFSFEFIGYYLDRNSRVTSMRRQLAELLDDNSRLVDEQKRIQEEYDGMVRDNAKEIALTQTLKNTLKKYHSVILKVAPNKKLPNLDLLGKQVVQTNTAYENHHPLATPHGVPTPAALKAGVGFPLGLRTSSSGGMNMGRGVQKSGRADVPLNNQCGICRKTNDQHLLAKCDTCHLYYHLGCLHPPLTRMPKKNKIMGWQCSECDKESSGSDVEFVDTEAPRRLRNVKENSNGDTSIKGEGRGDGGDGEKSLDEMECITIDSTPSPGARAGRSDESASVGVMARKKRRREKHHRYSPSPMEPEGGQLSIAGSRPHKRKHKRKSVDSSADSVSSPPEHSSSAVSTEPRQSLKICFKSIPHHTGEGSVYVATTPGTGTVRPLFPPSQSPISPTPPSPSSRASFRQQQQQQGLTVAKKKSDMATVCSTCTQPGSSTNLVVCDECNKGFHFHCLDPPVKKSPKVRGYSWHCADCDPTETDSS